MKWIVDKLLTLVFFGVLFLLVYLVLFYGFDVDMADNVNPPVRWSGERVMSAEEGKVRYVIGAEGLSGNMQEWNSVTHRDKEIGFRKDGVLVWRRYRSDQ